METDLAKAVGLSLTSVNERNLLMSRRFKYGCWLLLAIGALPSTARGQEASSDPPGTLRELIDAAIQQCEVFATADSKEPAKPLVVLRWANNARGSEDGMTLLYIHEGRPIAAACLYPWEGKLVYDFECISRELVVARRDGTIVWSPAETAVTFADIPGAPAPEATSARRLRQMKDLAGQFRSTMLGWKADSTDREELRLLVKPLFRYESKSGKIFDGAVFAFAMGTDPESLLLIEAVQSGEQAKWQFAFARRTSGELVGRHRDTVVWQAARYPVEGDPRKPHFSLRMPIPAELQQPAGAR